MANNEYVLTIRAPGATANKTKVASSATNDGNGEEGGGTSIAQYAGKFAQAIVGAPLAKQIFSYGASRVGVESGNMQAQAYINAGVSVGSKVLGTLATFAINPWAGLAKVGMDFISLAQQYNTFNYDRQMEGIALEQARLRAGGAVNKSRAFETNA